MAGSGEGSWRWTGTSTSGCKTSSAAARRARSQLNSAAVSTVSCRWGIWAVNAMLTCGLLWLMCGLVLHHLRVWDQHPMDGLHSSPSKQLTLRTDLLVSCRCGGWLTALLCSALCSLIALKGPDSLRLAVTELAGIP